MTDGQARAQAVLDGGMAALARKPASANPHPMNTPEYRSWARGHQEVAGAK